MNIDWVNVEKRLDQIVQVDVMSSRKSDFLATHMPFQKLGVQETGHQSAAEIELTEEEIYQRYIKNDQNEHRFIIVKGRNGAGKSHLIRWMQARMENDLSNSGSDKEKVIFIRRIDNSLRGAMRQLLVQGAVSDKEQYERMQQFIDSADAQSPDEIMSTIFYSFITLIETDEDETFYRRPERRRIYHFMTSDAVKSYLMSENGAISRYYELIVRPKGETNRKSPSFYPEDFLNMKTLRSEVLAERNNDARLVLHDLENPEKAERFCRFLNGYTQRVIQRCANIIQGDAESMISQLRRQLKAEGKSLTFFIEDMTTFTGIDSEIVKVLSIKHGGEYADLCRVTSVIGLTDAYYDSNFKGNFQDRVTQQINVGENAFGRDETLCDMAARYINAMYLSDTETDEWAKTGANFSSLPYKTVSPKYSWDTIQIDGRDFSLFPFTAKALSTLYQRLPEKSPRFFIRDVLKIQLLAFIKSKTNNVTFPSSSTTSIGSAPISFSDVTQESSFEARTQGLDLKEKKALQILLCIWGNATTRISIDPSSKQNYVANIPSQFFTEFNLPVLTGEVTKHEPTALNLDVNQPIKKATIIDPNLKKHLDDLESWKQNETPLIYSEDARGYVYNFLKEAIAWQSEGVPAYWMTINFPGQKSIYIEGQVQRTPDRDTATIAMDRNNETYEVLVALTYHHFHGNWSFENAAFYQVKCSVWLERHRNTFSSSFAGNMCFTEQQQLCIELAMEFVRLGITGCLDRNEKNLREKIFSPTLLNTNSHSGISWAKLLNQYKSAEFQKAFSDNKEAITRSINYIMGFTKDAATSKYLVKRVLVDTTYDEMCRLHWDISKSDFFSEKIGNSKRQNFALTWLREQLPIIKAILSEEQSRLHSIIEELKDYIVNPLEDESWSNSITEVKNFLNECNTEYSLSFSDDINQTLRWIGNGNNTSMCASIVRNGLELEGTSNFNTQIIFFSSDPCGIIEKALQFFKTICLYAEKQRENAQSSLDKLKLEVDNDIDEASSAVQKQIEQIYRLLEEKTDETN